MKILPIRQQRVDELVTESSDILQQLQRLTSRLEVFTDRLMAETAMRQSGGSSATP